MIEGVVFKDIVTHADERGYFRELIRATDAMFAGQDFGQCSHSLVHVGVIKAWHGHHRQAQWTYIASGAVQVAIHDLRPDSKTFGVTEQFRLGDSHGQRIYVLPPGVVHGYKCLEGPAHVFYMTSGTYDPSEELRLAYDDERIGYRFS